MMAAEIDREPELEFPASIPLVLNAVRAIPDIVEKPSWGELAFFHNPGMVKPNGKYVMTVKLKDGPNDGASRLDRGGLYRINLGLPKPLFREIFGLPPMRPGKGETIQGPWDFTEIDRITPHPVYGWMSWIAVINPERENAERLVGWIDRVRAGLNRR